METGYEAVGALIARHRKALGLHQDSVAVMLSDRLGREIRQNLVSKHERGSNWRSREYDPFELMRAYCEVLNIPENLMLATLGFPSALQGGEAEPAQEPAQEPTLADVIEKDPTLTRAAKDHLINQYGLLLQLASVQERSGKPVIKPPRRGIG